MSPRLLRDPHDSLMVCSRWVFVAFVVFRTVMMVLGIGLAIRDIRNHIAFDFAFWAGFIALMVLGTILVRARRFRRTAAARGQSRS